MAAVEHALLKRLDDFPRISKKDARKLRELGDMLSELESAKLDGQKNAQSSAQGPLS